jgi:hypothetical protein
MIVGALIFGEEVDEIADLPQASASLNQLSLDCRRQERQVV